MRTKNNKRQTKITRTYDIRHPLFLSLMTAPPAEDCGLLRWSVRGTLCGSALWEGGIGDVFVPLNLLLTCSPLVGRNTEHG